MKTGVRDFCLKYNEKLKNDKDIQDDKIVFFRDDRERIKFNVSMNVTIPNAMHFRLYGGDNLFTLDEEDLKYLYHKYSKKVVAEMELNITKVKESYEDAL